jgi:hypothetical protein
MLFKVIVTTNILVNKRFSNFQTSDLCEAKRFADANEHRLVDVMELVNGKWESIFF